MEKVKCYSKQALCLREVLRFLRMNEVVTDGEPGERNRDR
jgi:hypothetical protein